VLFIEKISIPIFAAFPGYMLVFSKAPKRHPDWHSEGRPRERKKYLNQLIGFILAVLGFACYDFSHKLAT